MIKWTDFPDFREALDEARSEGEMAASRAGVLKALQARFKRVPKAVVRAVEHVKDVERLNELIAHAATCPDLDAFRAGLTR